MFQRISFCRCFPFSGLVVCFLCLKRCSGEPEIKIHYHYHYLQQDVKTINRSLPRDESLAPEKVCTVLFGRGRLKVTMKRHTAAACANIAQVIRVRAQQNLRPLDRDRMCLV